jgi:hypothetical protein
MGVEFLPIRRSIHAQDHTQHQPILEMSPFMAQLRLVTQDLAELSNDEEVDMVGKISTALAAALVLASVGAASARPAWNTARVFAPSVERYDGITYPHSEERYCYMPSSPCGNNHRMTN